jgi:hypothetical protein
MATHTLGGVGDVRGGCRLLASRLATMARHAKALAVRHAVPFTSTAHRHDVIGVRLTAITAHAPARPALPRITGEHGLPPCSMGLVAVAACGSARPRGFVTAGATG